MRNDFFRGDLARDFTQETFIRAWRHLPQLRSGDYPVRPWLYRVARNLLIDADRAARSRPVTVREQAAEQGRDDTGLDRVLDQQIVADALHQLSPLCPAGPAPAARGPRGD